MLERNVKVADVLTFWNVDKSREQVGQVTHINGKNPCLKGTGYDKHLEVTSDNDGHNYLVSFNSQNNRWEGLAK